MNRKTPLITVGLVILFVAVLSAGLYTYSTYSRMKLFVSSDLRETYRYANRLQLDLKSFNLLLDKYVASPGPETLLSLTETLDLLKIRTNLVASACMEVDSLRDFEKECRDLFSLYDDLRLYLGSSQEQIALLLPDIRILTDEAEIIAMTIAQRTDLLAHEQMQQSGELLNQAGRRILMFLSALSAAILVIALLSFRQLKISGQLRTSELKFKSVFNQAFQFFGQLDKNGLIIDVNNAALRLIGKTKKELLGSFFADTPWWNHSEELQDKLRKAIITAASGRTVRMNARHIDLSGRSVYVDFSLKPIFDDRGEVAMLIAEGRDITTIIEAERELTHLRNYLSNMIDSMPSMIIGVDAQGRVTQWNRTVQEISGIKARDALGNPVGELIPEMQKDIDLITDSIDTGNTRVELKRSSVFGHEGHFEDLVISPLKGGDENGAVIRIDDVTEIVNMQEKIIHSEKMLSVGGLAAGLAHEINNPLAGMMQTAEVLYDRLSAKEIPANIAAAESSGLELASINKYMQERNILELLEGIRISGMRAATIVGNMLSFARKSGSEKSLQDVGRLMELSLELASTDYNLKKRYNFDRIRIVMDIEDELPRVMCEAQKIQQVFLNILKNGAQAMNEARMLQAADSDGYIPEFRISIRSSEESAPETSGVVVEIADNGTGMTEDVRKRIFEPFFTTKSVGEGTGLGLSVSYFIITENHNGTFRVESSEGQGTRFIISLP